MKTALECARSMAPNEEQLDDVAKIIAARDAEVRAECAKAAVAAVNDCRQTGESDLRSVRAWVDQAIRDPAAYAAERAETDL